MKYVVATIILLVHIGYSDWHIETVDDEGGLSPSLVLDSSGNPHISYWVNTSGYDMVLRYAYWNGSSWEIEAIDSSMWCGSRTSLALDDKGYPHIAYGDSENDYLKYAVWNGSDWMVEVVDSTGMVGDFASMALDTSGNPHISYCDYTDTSSFNLKYTRWNGSVWEMELVHTAKDAGFGTSIEVDSLNYPHISYIVLLQFSTIPGDMYYCHWTGSYWEIEYVCSIGAQVIIGTNTSLALDSSDNPHITCPYRGTSQNNLRYNYWTGTSWEIDTVDSIGLWSSITLDQSDYPHISYYCSEDSSLRYSSWNGSSWDMETVDSSGDVGLCTSIALDPMGNPHISYLDETNDNLKYAFYDPTGIEDNPASSELTISGVAPNPSVGTVSVNFEVPELSHVSFSVFDLSGRLVSEMQENEYGQGSHSVQFNGISPGIYFCKITAGGSTDTQSFVVIR